MLPELWITFNEKAPCILGETPGKADGNRVIVTPLNDDTSLEISKAQT